MEFCGKELVYNVGKGRVSRGGTERATREVDEASTQESAITELSCRVQGEKTM